MKAGGAWEEAGGLLRTDSDGGPGKRDGDLGEGGSACVIKDIPVVVDSVGA